MTILYGTAGKPVNVWDTGGRLVFGEADSPPGELSTLPDLIPGGEKRAPYALPTNPAGPFRVPNVMKVPAPDGSVCHPSVVDMVAETGEPFRGFRYWLAITPYSMSAVDLEDPCVYVSNYGWDWQTPQGLTNPIDDNATSPAKGGYNSDTELKWDPEGKRFILYWRTENNCLHAAESKDGIAWTRHFNVVRANGDLLVSPSLVRRGPGDWWLWAGAFRSVFVHRATNPLGPWTRVGAADVPDPGVSKGDLWHHSVLWDDATQRFFMLGDDRNWALFPAVSEDGITWTGGNFFLADGRTYRATMVPSDEPGWFDMWYSFDGTSDMGANWWTKYTRVPRTLWTNLV